MGIAQLIMTRAGWAAIWYGPEDDHRLNKLQAQVQALQQRVDDLQTALQTSQSQLPRPGAMAASVLDPYVTVERRPINGLAGPHVIFTGANFHIRSGSGVTEDSTGLGNLVIGYNEDNRDGVIISPDQRTGSHNVIIGTLHGYTKSGGMVAGNRNTINGAFATVTGGEANTASGVLASISGGQANTASGVWASVSGGQSNNANGQLSHVSAGFNNEASGTTSSVSGGFANSAIGDISSVSGGGNHKAKGNLSSVSGGQQNYAVGDASSISGGFYNSTVGRWSNISGGFANSSEGEGASVSGGRSNGAFGDYSSIGGGAGYQAFKADENIN